MPQERAPHTAAGESFADGMFVLRRCLTPGTRAGRKYVAPDIHWPVEGDHVVDVLLLGDGLYVPIDPRHPACKDGWYTRRGQDVVGMPIARVKLFLTRRRKDLTDGLVRRSPVPFQRFCSNAACRLAIAAPPGMDFGEIKEATKAADACLLSPQPPVASFVASFFENGDTTNPDTTLSNMFVQAMIEVGSPRGTGGWPQLTRGCLAVGPPLYEWLTKNNRRVLACYIRRLRRHVWATHNVVSDRTTGAIYRFSAADRTYLKSSGEPAGKLPARCEWICPGVQGLPALESALRAAFFGPRHQEPSRKRSRTDSDLRVVVPPCMKGAMAPKGKIGNWDRAVLAAYVQKIAQETGQDPAGFFNIATFFGSSYMSSGPAAKKRRAHFTMHQRRASRLSSDRFGMKPCRVIKEGDGLGPGSMVFCPRGCTPQACAQANGVVLAAPWDADPFVVVVGERI